MQFFFLCRLFDSHDIISSLLLLLLLWISLFACMHISFFTAAVSHLLFVSVSFSIIFFSTLVASLIRFILSLFHFASAGYQHRDVYYQENDALNFSWNIYYIKLWNRFLFVCNLISQERIFWFLKVRPPKRALSAEKWSLVSKIWHKLENAENDFFRRRLRRVLLGQKGAFNRNIYKNPKIFLWFS